MASAQKSGGGDALKLVLPWGYVGIPLVWGIVMLVNAPKAFH